MAVRVPPGGWLDGPAGVRHLTRPLPRGGTDAAGLGGGADLAAGIDPTLTGAGRVWNSSTPMRPATVAVITIGVAPHGVRPSRVRIFCPSLPDLESERSVERPAGSSSSAAAAIPCEPVGPADETRGGERADRRAVREPGRCREPTIS